MAARTEQAPLVLGAPFGRHDGLGLVDDAAGLSALAWRTTTGEGQAIDFAVIAPTNVEASPVETVVSASAQRLSTPELAISPDGRVAVAWFEQYEDNENNDDILAVKLRLRPPGGAWEAPITVWRATAKQAYRADCLAVSLDDSGDVAVVWATDRSRVADPKQWQLYAATRAADGRFGAPTLLDREAAETTPAVALTPNGEVTTLWARPWRSPVETLAAETWRAGSPPDGGVTPVDQGTPSKVYARGDVFTDLSLQTDTVGDELAAWLKGYVGSSDHPDLVALRAAWKPPRGPFEEARAVTQPGVEARQPSLTLSNDGRALLAWSEIAADGSGPLLNYATAERGQPLVAEVPGAVKLRADSFDGGDGLIGATWLPGDQAMLAWVRAAVVHGHEVTLGDSPTQGPPIQEMHENGLGSSEQPVLAGSTAARPVLAWIGRSPADYSAEAVRYVVGANLPLFSGPPTPTADLVGKRDPAVAGVTVNLVCPEACTAHVTSRAYSLPVKDAKSTAVSTYESLGTLTAAHVLLRSSTHKLVRLRLAPATSKRFCRRERRGDTVGVEVIATIKSAGAGARRIVLGEEPTPRGCGR